MKYFDLTHFYLKKAYYNLGDFEVLKRMFKGGYL